MLEAKRQQMKRKTVARVYGESLTSAQFIKRMAQEEEERQLKRARRGPGPAGKGKGKKPVIIPSEESESDFDDDRDEEWRPPKRSVLDDSDEDDDEDPFDIPDRNLFKDFSL